MASVSERIVEHYGVRREVSQIPDLTGLLLANLVFGQDARRPTAIRDTVRRLLDGPLENVTGNRARQFAAWLRQYLVVNKTVRGTSFYPVHPALSLPDNGEGQRVDAFIRSLASCFTIEERDCLVSALWSGDALPEFERTVYAIVDWQVSDAPSNSADPDRFGVVPHDTSLLSTGGILMRTKEDLLALSRAAPGTHSFVAHAGRLLALALTRYLLAMGNVDFSLPIYAAPAADTHQGVRTLAHEILEVHRAQLADSLRHRFHAFLTEELAVRNAEKDPPDEETARKLVKELFHSNANIVPAGRYQDLREAFGTFEEIAYHYYWSHGGATGRFLRQLHTAHLNLAKKSGLANSRSQYSNWHYYWLAPSLVETLLLVSREQLAEDRVLVATLLRHWRERYGIAVLVDSSWDAVYRRSFRALGSPESLNEANQRRFNEVLAERGRLHKNSDDFPWAVLKD